MCERASRSPGSHENGILWVAACGRFKVLWNLYTNPEYEVMVSILYGSLSLPAAAASCLLCHLFSLCEQSPTQRMYDAESSWQDSCLLLSPSSHGHVNHTSFVDGALGIGLVSTWSSAGASANKPALHQIFHMCTPTSDQPLTLLWVHVILGLQHLAHALL